MLAFYTSNVGYGGSSVSIAILANIVMHTYIAKLSLVEVYQNFRTVTEIGRKNVIHIILINLLAKRYSFSLFNEMTWHVFLVFEKSVKF